MKGTLERKIITFSNKIEGKLGTIEKTLEETTQTSSEIIAKSSGSWKIPFLILLVVLAVAGFLAFKKLKNILKYSLD